MTFWRFRLIRRGLFFPAVFFAYSLFAGAAHASAEEVFVSGGEAPLFSWDLLWSGSWLYKADSSSETGGDLANRGDLRLNMPRQDLSLRFQVLDKGMGKFWEPNEKDVFNPGAGLYYEGAGDFRFIGPSRVLWGIQDEYGLPSRIRNVWAKSIPYVENHRAFSRELKTETASTKKPETHVYLGLPVLGPFSGYAALSLDEESDPAFGGGAEFQWNKNRQTGASFFRLEGFYTEKKLEPRKAQSWFSSSPPLPERDFRIYALGTVLNTPAFAFASDLACSETFAYGRDIYGNAALRLGSRPWRLSLAADGTGSRFVGRDGAAVKEGFRLGGRLERLGTRSGLFRISGDFREPGAGEPFEQGSVSLYFRPPGRTTKKNALPQGLSRLSFSLGRDGRTREKTKDSVEASAGFNLGPFRTVFSGVYTALTAFDSGDNPFPLPLPPAFEAYDSAKVSGEISWSPGIFQLRTKWGYATQKEKESVWDASLYGSAKIGKHSRLSLKIAAPVFPQEWNYTLSWRFATE
jgi:hypothetical protein